MVPKNQEWNNIGTIVCYWSKFEVDRFRSDRGRIEAGKTDRGRAKGGPSGTKNGHLWAKLWPNFWPSSWWPWPLWLKEHFPVRGRPLAERPSLITGQPWATHRLGLAWSRFGQARLIFYIFGRALLELYHCWFHEKYRILFSGSFLLCICDRMLVICDLQ